MMPTWTRGIAPFVAGTLLAVCVLLYVLWPLLVSPARERDTPPESK